MTVAMLGSASSEVAFPQSAALDSVAQNASDAFSTVLLAGRSKPEWVRDVCRRLDSFRNLPANWDSYGAAKSDPASIEFAKLYLDTFGKIVGVEQPELGISPSGNVALSWEFANGKRNLEIEVIGNGVIRFAYLNEDDSSADQEGATSSLYEIANFLTHW